MEPSFVLPLFRHLGYPDTHLRSEYPPKLYYPGRRAGSPRVDKIYFSVGDPARQNADTALIIVEAKAPEKHDFDAYVQQAQFYGGQLKPLFLVVTNGRRLLVLRRHQARDDEVVFAANLDELHEREVAMALYNHLNFDVVSHLKADMVDELPYRRYAEVARALLRHPDLQQLLERGDFAPSRTRAANRSSMVTPKVQIACDLPVAGEEGGCQIDFSALTRLGLSVHLTHRDILGSLMTGPDTPPEVGARRFLRRLDSGGFEAWLGRIETTLLPDEARALCACVDAICHDYKGILVETETVLETWDYPLERVDDVRGFRLLSVSRWLWELMRKFALEHDYGKGVSEWHIFVRGNVRIRVGQSKQDHAYLWPKNGGDFLANGWVDVLYEIPNALLRWTEHEDKAPWQQAVGPRGLWTATYTRAWLLEQLIPRVLEYYAGNRLVRRFDPRKDIRAARTDRVPFERIVSPSQLISYVDDIQSWLTIYGTDVRVGSALLRPYYRAFADLARGADRRAVDIPYCADKLGLLPSPTVRDRPRVGTIASSRTCASTRPGWNARWRKTASPRTTCHACSA